MPSAADQSPPVGHRRALYRVIFQADTRAGRAFDLALIWLILASVLTVLLESVPHIRAAYGPALHAAEWAFTGLFTAEYLLRLYSVRRPVRYAVSLFGVIDLLAIAPTYLSLFVPGAQALLVVRVLRVLRVFRILKLTEYLRESRTLTDALWASRRKIGVFLLAVLTLLVIIGSLMYLIEGEENGFTDIPTSIYWAVVTLTTVGYGDISPKTPLGRVVAGAVMILGYGIIAVPTGIVTAELTRPGGPSRYAGACPRCGAGGHDPDARFCNRCGAALPEPPPAA
jgi:voltage-gated potassium channel